MTKSEEFYTKMFLQDEMEKEQFRFFHGDVVRLDKLPLEVEIYFDKFGTWHLSSALSVCHDICEKNKYPAKQDKLHFYPYYCGSNLKNDRSLIERSVTLARIRFALLLIYKKPPRNRLQEQNVFPHFYPFIHPSNTRVFPDN